jgi:predicted RNA-binding Zn ribbon-like protein
MVDGYPMPARFAGDVGLELCNTWAGWSTSPDLVAPVQQRVGHEYLLDFDRFAVWTMHVGLLDPEQAAAQRRAGAERPAHAGRVLRDVWRLRTALHDAVLDPADEEALATVTLYADRAARASTLTRTGDGTVVRSLPPSTGLALGLLTAAQRAERLLGDPVVQWVRACPGEGCGWLFVDSRRRRRWCSMSACGNRSKVRAYATRH